MLGYRDHVLGLYQEAMKAASDLRDLFLEAQAETYPEAKTAELRMGAAFGEAVLVVVGNALRRVKKAAEERAMSAG